MLVYEYIVNGTLKDSLSGKIFNLVLQPKKVESYLQHRLPAMDDMCREIGDQVGLDAKAENSTWSSKRVAIFT